jgi:hypothetical protein
VRGVVLLLALGLTGCGGARITPPACPADPASVFVADYGRHSSLILPSPVDGKLHEYTFGDFDWFALNRNAWHDALDALFCSDGAALGWRTLDPADDAESLARSTSAPRVLQLQVARDRASRLLEKIDARYRRHLPSQVFNPLMSLHFVRDDERYSWGNNCNHVTARWLEALGCTLRGSRMTSHFRLDRTHGCASGSSLRQHPHAPPLDAQPALLEQPDRLRVRDLFFLEHALRE